MKTFPILAFRNFRSKTNYASESCLYSFDDIISSSRHNLALNFKLSTMATPDADEMYGRRFGEPLIDGWPHISSLFNFSQGILCFAYCWLFLLGTINYMFPSLLLRDINTLRSVPRISLSKVKTTKNLNILLSQAVVY